MSQCRIGRQNLSVQIRYLLLPMEGSLVSNAYANECWKLGSPNLFNLPWCQCFFPCSTYRIRGSQLRVARDGHRDSTHYVCLPHTTLAIWLNPELQSPCYFSPELFSLPHAIIAIFHSPVLGSLKLKKSPELSPSLLTDTWDPGGKCSAQYAGTELNNSLLVWGGECN